jgi:hypothetical protein
MAFTQDELQSLNTIMEQKLSAQRQELEQAFEKRLQAYKSEWEQYFMRSQHDLMHDISRGMNEQNAKLRDAIQQKLDRQHTHTLQIFTQTANQQQQRYEDVVEHSLAAQLLAFEQLLNQRLGPSAPDLVPSYVSEPQVDFSSIEVQTEIPWEELIELIEHSVDERFTSLKASLLTVLEEHESSLTAQIQSLRDVVDMRQKGLQFKEEPDSFMDLQDVFNSIAQLEHLIEAMQVAMTANSALLSNRLYHHQHLPLERAHPTSLQDSPLESEE